MDGLRTWVEIDQRALYHNVGQFLKLIPKKTRLMAVVKSNAYGHDLTLVAKLLANFQFSIFNFQKLWFGVDSLVEAIALRRAGIKNPILVLGSTLSSRLEEAFSENITLTVANFEALTALRKNSKTPVFHIKVDTGMHRQGFLPKDIFKLIKLLKYFKLSPQGVYTHFASAKDIAYPTYTLEQLRKFKVAVSDLKKAGFKNLIRHAAASGGTLLFPDSRLDMVRIGMGLYGYFPSFEAKFTYQGQTLISLTSRSDLDKIKRINLRPVLTWKTVIAETKEIPAGSYIGYDLTEKVARKTKIAVLPIGYWHGYDRGLSSIGEVLIRGKRAKVLGRVSMDMVVVDITDIDNEIKNQPCPTIRSNGQGKSTLSDHSVERSRKIKVGDEAVLIGKQGKEEIWADELALKIGTTAYEFLTRINPLIKRITV